MIWMWLCLVQGEELVGWLARVYPSWDGRVFFSRTHAALARLTSIQPTARLLSIAACARSLSIPALSRLARPPSASLPVRKTDSAKAASTSAGCIALDDLRSGLWKMEKKWGTLMKHAHQVDKANERRRSAVIIDWARSRRWVATLYKGHCWSGKSKLV
jgi:hypothetical protein